MLWCHGDQAHRFLTAFSGSQGGLFIFRLGLVRKKRIPILHFAMLLLSRKDTLGTNMVFTHVYIIHTHTYIFRYLWTRVCLCIHNAYIMSTRVYRNTYTFLSLCLTPGEDTLAALTFCAPHRPLGRGEKPHLRFSQHQFWPTILQPWVRTWKAEIADRTR